MYYSDSEFSDAAYDYDEFETFQPSNEQIEIDTRVKLIQGELAKRGVLELPDFQNSSSWCGFPEYTQLKGMYYFFIQKEAKSKVEDLTRLRLMNKYIKVDMKVEEVAEKLLLLSRTQYMANELRKQKLPSPDFSSYKHAGRDGCVFYDRRCDSFVAGDTDWPWEGVSSLVETLLNERQERIEELNKALEQVTTQMLDTSAASPFTLKEHACSSSDVAGDVGGVSHHDCDGLISVAAFLSRYLTSPYENNTVSLVYSYEVPSSVIQVFSIEKNDHYFHPSSASDFRKLCDKWINHGEGTLDSIIHLPNDRLERNQDLWEGFKCLEINKSDGCYKHIKEFIDTGKVDPFCSICSCYLFNSYLEDDNKEEAEEEEAEKSTPALQIPSSIDFLEIKKEKQADEGVGSSWDSSTSPKERNKNSEENAEFIALVFQKKRHDILKVAVSRKQLHDGILETSNKCIAFIQGEKVKGIKEIPSSLSSMHFVANQLADLLVIDEKNRRQELLEKLSFDELDIEMQQAVSYAMETSNPVYGGHGGYLYWLNPLTNNFIEKKDVCGPHRYIKCDELVGMIKKGARAVMFDKAAIKLKLPEDDKSGIISGAPDYTICYRGAESRRSTFINGNEPWSQLDAEIVVKSLIQEYEDRLHNLKAVFASAKLEVPKFPFCGSEEVDEYIMEARHSPQEILKLVRMSILMQAMEPDLTIFFNYYDEEESSGNSDRLFNEGMLPDESFYDHMLKFINDNLLSEFLSEEGNSNPSDIFFELKQQLIEEREGREKDLKDYLLSKGLIKAVSHGFNFLPTDLRTELSWYLSVGGQDNERNSNDSNIFTSVARYTRFHILKEAFDPMERIFLTSSLKLKNYLICPYLGDRLSKRKPHEVAVLKRYSPMSTLQQICVQTVLQCQLFGSEELDKNTIQILKSSEFFGEPRCVSFIIDDNFGGSVSNSASDHYDVVANANALVKQLILEREERHLLIENAAGGTMKTCDEIIYQDDDAALSQSWEEWVDFGIGTVEDICLMAKSIEQKEKDRKTRVARLKEVFKTVETVDESPEPVYWWDRFPRPFTSPTSRQTLRYDAMEIKYIDEAVGSVEQLVEQVNKVKRDEKLRQGLSSAQLSLQSVGVHAQCINFVEKGNITGVSSLTSEDAMVLLLLDLLKKEKAERVRCLHEALESVGIEDFTLEETEKKDSKIHQQREYNDDSFANLQDILELRSNYIEFSPKEKAEKMSPVMAKKEVDAGLKEFPESFFQRLIDTLERRNYSEIAMDVAVRMAQFYREVAIVTELQQRNSFPKKVLGRRKRGDNSYIFQQWAKRNDRCIEFANNGSYEGIDTVQQLVDSLIAEEALHPDSKEFAPFSTDQDVIDYQAADYYETQAERMYGY